jgi:hypothetical protein
MIKEMTEKEEVKNRNEILLMQNDPQGPKNVKMLLKVNKSQKQILKFSFEPKTNENIFVFLP